MCSGNNSGCITAMNGHLDKNWAFDANDFNKCGGCKKYKWGSNTSYKLLANGVETGTKSVSVPTIKSYIASHPPC